MADMARTIETYTTASGEPRFKVRYWRDKRQTSRTFTTDAGAREFDRLIDGLGVEEADRIIEERIDAPAGSLTFGECAHQHVATLTGVGEGYRQRCRRTIDADMRSLVHLPMTAITGATVRAWVNELERTGLSGKTIKNKHGLLSAIMNAAVRERVVPANPCTGVRLPRTVAAPMTFLTPEEYTRFLGYFTPAWQPMVTLMFATGARFSELTAVTVADVDLEAATMSITKAWKDGGKRIGPPKSRKSVRTLSLPPEAVTVLASLVEGRPGDALLLTNARGGPVRLQTFHDNVWQPAVKLANGEPSRTGVRASRRRDEDGARITPAAVPLGKRPRPHDARHSCASWLLGSGIPINYVQAHLGHESITTTVGTYGHIMPAARQAVAGALSLALAAAHPQIEA